MTCDLKEKKQNHLRIDYVMQGHFAVLSFKHNIYHVLSFTNIYYLLSNSQRQMLCYYITHILKDTGLFKLEWREFEKLFFNFYFLK